MAEYRIENEKLSVMVNSHGGELRSLVCRDTGREVMWCGDSAYWGRVSPVLFPVVGAYREKKCTYQGETFRLGQHGFARDKEFALVEQGKDRLRFALEMSREEARENGYPFAFSLELGYLLEEDSLRVTWQVKNPGEETMYFSIGGHPAFAVPGREPDQTTCYIELKGVDTLRARALEGGLASRQIKSYPLEDHLLPVTEELFAGDALVVENRQTGEVSLLDEKKECFLTVTFDAPLFGLWTPPGKNAPFLCIEPWYGRCDGVDFQGSLQEREWGNCLRPGESFYAEYRIHP